MPVTRRSAAGGAPPPPKPTPKSRRKRAAEGQSSKFAKRSKTGETEKDRKSIEETMDGVGKGDDTKNVDAHNDVKGEQKDAQNDTTETKNEDASSILEKGIIYFFFRGRVNIDEPQGVEDIARSYIILRPLPLGTKLGEGPLEDAGNARLLALPKKVLPKSKRDRVLAFVEKHGISIKDLKDNFVAGNEYATKTVGTSHIPAATPIAEGIYAIASKGRASHLAYHITIPDPLGEVQKDMGISAKGSYVVSVKNPTIPAPGNVGLPRGADYPESIMQKFRGLRWMPLEPEVLDYDNTQILIIGEGMGIVDRATEEQDGDAKNSAKNAPVEEMEKLEDEDHIRVEHLKGDDAVFADLGLSSEKYPKIQTTW